MAEPDTAAGHQGPDDQRAAIAFLAEPASHGGAPVTRLDTHGAVVILAGERGYKLKRAVAFPYMDFSTLARREAACRAEVGLNRRTAPALYLGLAPILGGPDGRLSLGAAIAPDAPAPAGPEVRDWVVVMRRFDQDGLFDRLAERGALTPEQVEDLAEAVAHLHDLAEPRHAGGDGSAALRWVIAENLAELREQPALFPAEQVARLAAHAGAALDRTAALLDRRAAAGRVRHCHGDLHLGNVVLIEGRPTLFDAIEFNEALAVIDVAYDLAFLLLDLVHRGLRPLANRALNRYLERTGDIEALAALPLFLSTRAAVRAKVSASAIAAQAEPAAASHAAEQARAYLDTALAMLEPAPARLVAIGGLSGTGKTTAARGLAPGLGPVPGAVILRSDVLRKRIREVADGARLPAEAYAPAVTAQVYGELARRAGAVLAAGHAAIADAVFARPEERAAIERVAAEAGVPFFGAWLQAPEPALLDRVEARAAAPRPDASDADGAVVRRQGGYDLGPIGWARIEAGGSPEATLAALAAAAG